MTNKMIKKLNNLNCAFKIKTKYNYNKKFNVYKTIEMFFLFIIALIVFIFIYFINNL